MALSGVRVRTSVHVAAKSYVYISNEISRIFYETIQAAGLDPTAYARLQETIENGLRTWITLRYLEAAHLEILDPATQRVRTRVDLGLTYVDNYNDDRYATDIARVRSALSGTARLDGCTYRVVVTLADGAPAVKGWDTTTLGSVDHLQRQDVGSVIEAPAGTVMMFRWS